MATLLRRVADFFRETFLQTRISDTANREGRIQRRIPLAVRQRLRHHTVSPALRRSTVHWANYLWCARYTAPRQIRALPTEVCERIIDFVAEESPYYDLFDLWNTDVYETLLACALACRAWAPRSRFHLFRFLGASCSQHSPRNVEGLYSMVKRQQYLQQYVEALLVKGDDQELPTMHTLPLKAPQLLTYLEYLRLADGILYLPPASIVAMRQFTMVTQLSLERITFWSAHDLRRVICTMSGLQALEISWPTWKTPHDLKTDEHTRYPPSPIRLTDIYIFAEVDAMQNGHLAYFIEWLARSGVATSLTRIGLWQLMIPDSRLLTAVQSVIETSKDSLSDLYLSWCPDVDPLPCKWTTSLPQRILVKVLFSSYSMCIAVIFRSAALPWIQSAVPHKDGLWASLNLRQDDSPV